MKRRYSFALVSLFSSWLWLANFQYVFGNESINPSAYEFVGYHLVASYQGCDPEKLKDVDGLRSAMLRAINASGATLLDSVDYVFPPNGYTLVMLLSESHASIHTYPEYNACFVDFFTCGRGCSSANFDIELQNYLNPQSTVSNLLYRDGSHVIIQE